jgi:outer membrane protein TolC
VVRLERLLELEEQRQRDNEALAEQADVLLKAGRTLPSQREQVTLSVEESRLDVDARRTEVQAARATLLLAIGSEASPDRLRLAAGSIPSALATASEAQMLTDVPASPELRVLDLRARVEEMSVAVARAEAYPTLTVGAAYNNYGTKRYDNFNDEISVGVDFTVPLFHGFHRQHAVAEALKSAEIARLRYESALGRKRVRIRDLMQRLAAAQKRPELAHQRARLARERQRLADLNLRAERGDLVQALAAREESDRAARAAIEADFKGASLWAELQRETGTLAAAILGEEDAPPAPQP